MKLLTVLLLFLMFNQLFSQSFKEQMQKQKSYIIGIKITDSKEEIILKKDFSETQLRGVLNELYFCFVPTALYKLIWTSNEGKFYFSNQAKLECESNHIGGIFIHNNGEAHPWTYLLSNKKQVSTIVYFQDPKFVSKLEKNINKKLFIHFNYKISKDFINIFELSSLAEDNYYISKNGIICGKDNATYLRKLTPIEGNLFRAKDYSLDDDYLYSESEVQIETDNGYNDIPRITGFLNHGKSIIYYNDGTIHSNFTYLNGKKEGLYELFYSNGKKKERGKYEDGQIIGTYEQWYTSGSFKGTFSPNIKSEIDQPYLVHTFFDSLGNQEIVDGNGIFSFPQDSIDYDKGELLNGRKTGVWKGTFFDGLSHYEETYKNGKLVKGVSYDESNNKYEYSDYMLDPEYGANGLKDLYTFLSENIEYPKLAKDNGIQGKVYVQFIINKDGSVDDVKIIKGVHLSLDKEATRIVSMLKWQSPAYTHGQKIRARYTLPIRFKIS